MPFMSTDIQTTVDEDAEAVLQHAFRSKPLAPDVARRVREWAAEITERIRREPLRCLNFHAALAMFATRQYSCICPDR